MGSSFRSVVINAGLGDLTLGLTQAGFKVETVYEPDAPAAAVHQANFEIPVCPCLPYVQEALEMPQFDLLAGRLDPPGFERHKHQEYDPSLYSFLNTLSIYRPRAFLLLLNAGAIQKDRHQPLLERIAQAGYWSAYRKLDTAQITGFPVQERKIVMIGGREEGAGQLYFPEFRTSPPEPPERFLEPAQLVDPWYFQVRRAEEVPLQEGVRFYCWKGHSYVGTNHVSWNPRIVPLVWDDHVLRKITHRETANLKGFPEAYAFPFKNKNRLYGRLMYAGNILVIRQTAEAVRRILEEQLWRRPQRARSFEELLGRYLSGEAKVDFAPQKRTGAQPDLVVEYSGGLLLIEARSYSSAAAPDSRLIDACRRLRSGGGDGTWVLAVANKVSPGLRARLAEEYGVHVWDVANLLWLFEGHEEIKKEFIALLDYTVEGIEPEPPYPNLLRNEPAAAPKPEETEPELSWKERLDKVVPGKDQAPAYETLCVQFLKSVLNTYLTLWKMQERSNDGLYRFDLCCKIKMGADENVEFFDTIQRYFNTKYIVFEFKNYSEAITQKEIYTTEKYLYEKALRKVAVIISRKGMDKHAEQAVRGCLRETGKLILCLSDDDLLKMNALEECGEGDPVDVLGEKLDALLIDLEK